MSFLLTWSVMWSKCGSFMIFQSQSSLKYLSTFTREIIRNFEEKQTKWWKKTIHLTPRFLVKTRLRARNYLCVGAWHLSIRHWIPFKRIEIRFGCFRRVCARRSDFLNSYLCICLAQVSVEHSVHCYFSFCWHFFFSYFSI